MKVLYLVFSAFPSVLTFCLATSKAPVGGFFFNFYRFAVHSVDYLITHTNTCIYIYTYMLFNYTHQHMHIYIYII